MPRAFLGSHANRKPARLDVRPDDTDSRDYMFEPSVALLPETLDPRPQGRLDILDQGADGACVGHALAAVINLSLARRQDSGNPGVEGTKRKSSAAPSSADLVSEAMLYEMGRRYDEWAGEHYEGTSLRGAMKGWHHHGVCSRVLWKYRPKRVGHLTPDRSEDAKRRPLGSYYRILDSDVAHVQAAIFEGDAILASLWIHSGWALDRLLPAGAMGLRRIPYDSDIRGLHAVALVGYSCEGFIVQNSWGNRWGTGGLAILGYQDWFANRQDAWVSRPGPPTCDQKGRHKIYLDAFAGEPEAPQVALAGTSGAEGLNIDREALSYIVNTGDRGELSNEGRLATRKEDLPEMATRVLLAQPKNGVRDVVFYAHGGLVSETAAAQTAGRLWAFSRELKLTSYFFAWETGFTEAFLGMLRSQDDALGPRTGFDFGLLLREIKDATKKALREAQKKLGRKLAGFARPLWQEMHGRAQGAAATPKGGAASFADKLFDVMEHAPGSDVFRLHLVGHSAGSIFLGRLYRGFLAPRLQASQRVQLGSVQFMAPAITVPLARQIFGPESSLPVPAGSMRVFTLSDGQEDTDTIGIYPSSVLTYVADNLEDGGRVPLLGIAADLRKAQAGLGNPKHVLSDRSRRHVEFDDPGHEAEDIFRNIASL